MLSLSKRPSTEMMKSLKRLVRSFTARVMSRMMFAVLQITLIRPNRPPQTTTTAARIAVIRYAELIPPLGVVASAI